MKLPRIPVAASLVTASLVAATVAFGAGAAAGATSPLPPASGLAASAQSGPSFVPGRLLVHFHAGTAAATQSTDVRSVGAANAGTIRDLGVNIVDVPAGAEQRVANALLRTGHVSFAERDAVGAVTSTPNDTYWPQQWGPAKVNAAAAWDSTTGSASTVVAVLDTGVTYSHPDMQGRLLSGYDFVNNDSDPTDDNGHGTETAGIVGAAANNGIGMAGMCWSCSVLPVKVADSTGSASWSNVASGITWATDQGAKVISLSIGGTSGGSTLQSAVQYAQSHDVLVVAAAGNNGSSALFYPAAYAGVVSVAGTSSSDALYSWSDYGSWVSVAAPGCDYATNMSGVYSSSFCGTSAATPVVAGIVGLARSLAPSASAPQVASALESSAANIGSVVAYGRVDAAATMAALSGGTPPPSPAPPPATATTTTTTVSGSLSTKATLRSYPVSSGAGSLQLTLTFAKASSLTLTVRSANQTVLQASGASPLPAALTVPAGSYTVTVSGSTRATFTLTVTNPTP
jgi:thermitase